MDRKHSRTVSFAPGNPAWKTFVLEAHASGEPLTFLADVFGSRNVRETDDVNLHEMWSGEASYIVDTNDIAVLVVSHFCYGKAGASTHRSHGQPPTRPRLRVAAVRAPSRRPTDRSDPLGQDGDCRAQEFLSDDNVQDLSFSARGKPAQSLLDMIGSLPEYTYALCLNQIGILAQDDLLGVVEEAVTRKATFLLAVSPSRCTSK